MLLAPQSFPVTYNAFEVLLEFFNSLIDSVLSSVGRKVELQESNMVGSCVLQAKSIHSFFSFFFFPLKTSVSDSFFSISYQGLCFYADVMVSN